MPHIRLETTADLQENAQLPDILADLVAELSRHETISSASIKAYHQLRSTWQMGEGAPEGFVHCEVAILSGRPLPLRKAISEGIADVLRRHFVGSLDAGEASLTVEVREMDRETYWK